MAWNWYENKELWLKVDYWVGSWGPRQGLWGVYNEGRGEGRHKAHGIWPLPQTGRAGVWSNARVNCVWVGEAGGVDALR